VSLLVFLTVLAALRSGVTLDLLRLVPILLALSLIVVTDLCLRLIPNKITFPAIVYALLTSLVGGLSSFGLAVLGALVAGGAILLLAMVSRGGIGGGDLKLMVLIGATLGWQGSLTVFVLSQVTALTVAIVLSVYNRKIFRGWVPVGAMIAGLAGIAIAARPI
jgi:Flp pilus assembly protein protease CpaA